MLGADGCCAENVPDIVTNREKDVKSLAPLLDTG